MFDVLVRELAERYGLGDRSRDLFGLLVGYIYNDRRGGFAGFAESFRQQGQGELFASWLGGDPRRQRTANASDIGMVFGQGLLADWGNRLGASRATVAAAIAGVLPRLVGELTPGGRLPEIFGTAGGEPAIPERPTAPDPAPDVFGERIATPPELREPPRFTAPPATSANPSLRRERPHGGDERIEPIDPHVAAINAAMSSGADANPPAFAHDGPLRDFEFRPPAPTRRGKGWLWFLIVLALIGAALYYGRDYLPLDQIQWPGTATPSTS